MPQLAKYIETGLPYLVTSRTEEGLPFPANSSFTTLFCSILARAQKLYPVEISAFCLMANHFHMLLVPLQPEDFPNFVGYVKQEMAHSVNRLSKRRKHTIWCSGYDSPLLLGKEEVLEYLCYIYTQPQKAHLVGSIEQYPGASSWDMFINSKHTVSFPISTRPAPLSFNRTKINDLILTPFAWVKAFRKAFGMQASEANLKKEVIALVRSKENELARLRRKEKISLRGASQLVAAPINLTYKPKKFGRRSLCICRDIPFRKAFISFYKRLREKAQAVLTNWRRDDFSVPWPPGLFPPCFPKFSNPVRGYALGIAGNLNW